MIELKSNYLRALLVTAAKGDNTYRPQLCGIHFRSRAGRIEAHSTDGHRASKWLIAETSDSPDFAVIVSTKAIKHALYAKDDTVKLTPTGKLISSLGVSRGTIDRDYVDIDRVFGVDGVINRIDAKPMFNSKYLADLDKVSRHLRVVDKNNGVHLCNHSNNEKCFFVFDHVHDFVSVIMPLREGSGPSVALINVLNLNLGKENDCE